MNTVVRILCILPKFHHITDLLMNLHWLPVHQRILLEVLVLTYTVCAKEILTLLKRRKKFTAKQGIKFHIPLSLLSVDRV